MQAEEKKPNYLLAAEEERLGELISALKLPTLKRPSSCTSRGLL